MAILGETRSLSSNSTVFSSLPVSLMTRFARSTSFFEKGMRMIVVAMLNMEWNPATANELIAVSNPFIFIRYLAIKYIIRPIIVPIRLKLICITDTFFAFLFTPIEDKSAVTQVPIFCPIIMGIAIPYVIEPVSESA